MLVNNINIEEYNAMLEEKDIQTANITTFSDWLDNSREPLYFKDTEKYILINLKFYIDCKNDDEAVLIKSNFIKQLKKCTIKFDDIKYYYDCVLDSQSSTRIIPGKYELSIKLKSGYAYIGYISKIFNKSLSTSFQVGGNVEEIAAIVEITPTASYGSLTLKGLSDTPIIINTITANKKIIINGEDGTVLEDGKNKYKDIDLWEFPRLKIGTNNISVDKDTYNITIKYRERYI